MELISGLAAVVAPVFLIAAAGFIWEKRGYPFDQGLVTNLMTLVAAPCLVFSTFTTTRISFAEAGLMVQATLACLGLFALVAFIGLKLAGMPLRVYLPSLVFPNIGNLGLPVCLFAFGDRGLALATVFFAVTTIGQFTLGPAVASGRFQLGAMARTPLIYAVVVALLLGGYEVPIPRWIANTTSLAGGMAVPLMLIALGVALAKLKAANLGRSVAMAVARLGMGVAGGWVVATFLFNLDGIQRGVVIIESAMPVAVFNYLFAVMYDNQPEEVAGMVLTSTALALVGLPFLVAFVT
ncbi:AEC family transporter [Paramagnetospirillum magneticum]|uniref:Predicted permease n=1 Tax=Paramagnetospirillum magneticum (strain ATCC 700264 / AMB-1) TaxID=342108 RepID=Q2W301_PARM1|nr:AEC family transporter [Paramagnetospirillum magneticum]BAE51774.1 Predicted permease [Paramagnetospirillum magneticum AMB-1]